MKPISSPRAGSILDQGRLSVPSSIVPVVEHERTATMLVEGDIDQTMQRLRRAALGGDAAALHRLEAMIRRLPREKAQAEADATTIAEELVTLRREGQPAAAAEQRPWVLRLNGEFVEDFGARWGSGGQDPLPEAVEAREGIVRGLVKILERSSIELVPVPISADRA